MKTIYLKDKNYNWKNFEYSELSELKDELDDREISIGDDASIGNRASIGDGASIGNRASVGDDASIGNRASIGDDASIGDRASIGNRASIGDDASIGDRASIGGDVNILTGIYLNGSKHTVTYCGEGRISIGCENKTIEEWKENFKQIGLRNGYTDDQIIEYGNYIDIIELFYEKKKK